MSTLSEFLGLEPGFDFEEEIPKMVLNHEQYTDVKYTVYIPSKDRAQLCHTAKLLDDCGITNYKIVVEPQDYESYVNKWGPEKIVQLPDNDQGIAFSRSFIKKYSQSQGEKFHWQVDDDVISFRVRQNNKNVKINPKHCFSIVETINDKFTNIGMCGITHLAYAFAKKTHVGLNKFAYCVVLVNNNTPHLWRKNILEDLDYSLQTLDQGLVILTFNSIIFEAPSTGTVSGGNMTNMFKDDNRKKIYDNTVIQWPDRMKVIEVKNKNKGWTLKHIRKFYNDYKQTPRLKEF
jgi:hypothetical protein